MFWSGKRSHFGYIQRLVMRMVNLTWVTGHHWLWVLEGSPRLSGHDGPRVGVTLDVIFKNWDYAWRVVFPQTKSNQTCSAMLDSRTFLHPEAKNWVIIKVLFCSLLIITTFKHILECYISGRLFTRIIPEKPKVSQIPIGIFPWSKYNMLTHKLLCQCDSMTFLQFFSVSMPVSRSNLVHDKFPEIVLPITTINRPIPVILLSDDWSRVDLRFIPTQAVCIRSHYNTKTSATLQLPTDQSNSTLWYQASQKYRAQTKRIAVVKMRSPSGATGARRYRLWNSKIRGPPVTVYVPGWVVVAGFRMIETSCIFVGTSALGFGFALVTGKFVAGERHHFSMRRRVCEGFTEIMRTIFTSPPELMSHHRASTLKRASPSESPDSNTMVGQPPIGREMGLKAVSASLEEPGPENVVPPTPFNLFSRGMPHCICFSCISSARVMCADSCLSEGISLIIISPVSVWCSILICFPIFARCLSMSASWAFVTSRNTRYWLFVRPARSSSE